LNGDIISTVSSFIFLLKERDHYALSWFPWFCKLFYESEVCFFCLKVDKSSIISFFLKFFSAYHLKYLKSLKLFKINSSVKFV